MNSFLAAWTQLAGPESALSFAEGVVSKAEEIQIQLELQNYKKLDFTSRIKDRFLSPAGERSLLSRKCLITVVQCLLSQGVQPKNIQLSLSHSGTRAIAIASSEKSGVGVDLESSQRMISAGAAQKFTHGSENELGLTSLQIWVIKEACYKANPSNEGTVLSHYLITQFKQGRGAAQINDTKIEFILESDPQFTVAFAIVV